ncbi:MAG: DUF2950 family protein [Limisphaerales bacterium]
MKSLITLLAILGCAAAGHLLGQEPEPASGQRTFSSPGEAISALRTAESAKDKGALRAIFGPEFDQLLTGDRAQDAKNEEKFAANLAAACNPVPEGSDKVILEVGTNHWPMPISLVKSNGQWHFDTAAGKEEIVIRHIGKDELHAIAICHAYASEQHLGASVDDATVAPHPAHGYYFRVLTRQGPAAPGGRKNYVHDGRFENGFALLAYPERWDKSGVMTFIAGQDGVVYERNLGANTPRLARRIKAYNLGNDWKRVEDEGILSTDAGQ